MHVDLTEAVEAETARPAVLAGALGPDDRLAAVLLRRLGEAGLRDDDRIVLAVAGSSDRRAVDDCRDMAARLAAASGRDVSLGFLSAAEPRLPDAVAAARSDAAADGGRVVVANYLLAPGFFDDLTRAAGADVTARPLLVPDEPAPRELVDIVLDRYDAASRRWAEPPDAASRCLPLMAPRGIRSPKRPSKRSRSSTTASCAGATPCFEQRRHMTQCDTA